jgi:membrane-associated phospholipid phosphatase
MELKIRGKTFVTIWMLFILSLGVNPEFARAEESFPTRRPLPDLIQAGRITLYDTGRVYSTPWRLNRRQLLKAGGLIALGGLIMANDEKIAAEIRRGRNGGPLKPFIELGEALEPTAYQGNTNVIYAGGLLLGYALDWPLLRDFCGRIIEAHLVAGIGKNGANLLVGRRRPFEELGPYDFELGGGTSFPSGHAVTVMALTGVLMDRSPHLLLDIAIATGGLSVCLQRVSSEAHWPSDVYFGALFGWGVARVLLDEEAKRRGGLRVDTLFRADGAGLQLSGTF